MNTGTSIQAVLLVFYAVLAVVFWIQGGWPLSLYYVGCLVKDSAVFALAVLNRQ